jgi:hypothetical protein
MIYSRFGDVVEIFQRYEPICIGNVMATPVAVRYPPENTWGITVAEVLRADNGIVEIQEAAQAAPLMGELSDMQIADLRGRFS